LSQIQVTSEAGNLEQNILSDEDVFDKWAVSVEDFSLLFYACWFTNENDLKIL
jgi:hypothetical protein